MIFKLREKPFHLSLGTRGEIVASDFLTKHGFRILERNYRCALGEIDVVAGKEGRIVFVEVKTRAHERFGTPEESVNKIKQKKLTRLAEWYLKEKRKNDASVSFAVVSVKWKGTGEPEIKIIENAFGLND